MLGFAHHQSVSSDWNSKTHRSHRQRKGRGGTAAAVTSLHININSASSEAEKVIWKNTKGVSRYRVHSYLSYTYLCVIFPVKLTESPTVYECLEILKHPLLHKSLFILETSPFPQLCPATRLFQATTNNVWYNDDKKCGISQMHSSQKRKPAQRVVVEVEEHIQISDSKVVFFSQFVSFVWTLENFYVLAQLLPLLWSLISLGHK